ncbi:MAG: DUF3883 domain-containing protein [Prevotellaceae bacterium]|jgi:hypothetical protein|nr:DUF3883 domain-containing protein [Prevotellaceae bacterium]
MYDHTKQYRCPIIRGKSQKDIDNLLPVYANIIDAVCPCKTVDFPRFFNDELKKYLKNDNEKTLSNHRTEIAGKLFGMFYEKDGLVQVSDKTRKFLADNDQPAFFKDFCYKMQFPNGMEKPQTIQEHIKNKIKIRPYSFVLKVMLLANDAHLILTKKDIGYYILNSYDVLRGKATPDEVITQIVKDRTASITREVRTPGKELSYDRQHIIEQLNYLELANLVVTDNKGIIVLNKREMTAIKFISDAYNANLMFDIYAQDLSTSAGRKKFKIQWGIEYALTGEKSAIFNTSSSALGVIPAADNETPAAQEEPEKIEIGEEGEMYVFNYEKKRVKEYNKHLAGKVVYLGKIKGLGYDVQSIIALHGAANAELAKYIEVKTTRRVTAPDLTDTTWEDIVQITKNEWDAACQHKELYSIYRVYFCRDNVVIYFVDDVYHQKENGKIQVIPTNFRVYFTSQSVTNKYIENANGGQNV